MAAPTLEVRVAWRGAGFSGVANDGFESDTTGWSIASSAITAAATSLVRTSAQSYAETYSALLTTTTTSGSGTYYALSGTYYAGRTYRYRVALRWYSGITAARLRFGSIGTPADRVELDPTITGSWVVYQVDWTPSANRTDAAVTVSNDQSAAMEVYIDHAEVYEVIDDITSYVIEATWTRGLSLAGAMSTVGTLAIIVKNSDQRFDPANTSGPYGSLVDLGREVWVRSTYSGAPKAHFHGAITRVALMPQTRTAMIEASDLLDVLARADVSVAASVTRAVHTFRGLVLDDAGIPAARRSLTTADPESTIGLTEVDQDSALSVLERMNEATGTVHYVQPSVSASVLSRYVTRARPTLATGSPVETWSGSDVTVNDVEYDIQDVVNVMKVTPVQRGLDANQVVWRATRLPFTVDANQTRTLWASFTDPVFDQTVYSTATNAPTVTLTAWSRTAKVTITAGASATTVSDLYIMGEPYTALDQETAEYRDPPSVTTYYVRVPIGRYLNRVRYHLERRFRFTPSTLKAYGRRDSEIVSDWVPTTAHAEGLASWWVYRYSEPIIRPSVVVYGDDYGTQVNRELKQRVALTSTRLSLSSTELLITSLTATVRPGGEWSTVYQTEQAPVAHVWFTLGGTADEGIGGSGILAY